MNLNTTQRAALASIFKNEVPNAHANTLNSLLNRGLIDPGKGRYILTTAGYTALYFYVRSAFDEYEQYATQLNIQHSPVIKVSRETHIMQEDVLTSDLRVGDLVSVSGGYGSWAEVLFVGEKQDGAITIVRRFEACPPRVLRFMSRGLWTRAIPHAVKESAPAPAPVVTAAPLPLPSVEEAIIDLLIEALNTGELLDSDGKEIALRLPAYEREQVFKAIGTMRDNEVIGFRPLAGLYVLNTWRKFAQLITSLDEIKSDALKAEINRWCKESDYQGMSPELNAHLVTLGLLSVFEITDAQGEPTGAMRWYPTPTLKMICDDLRMQVASTVRERAAIKPSTVHTPLATHHEYSRVMDAAMSAFRGVMDAWAIYMNYTGNTDSEIYQRVLGDFMGPLFGWSGTYVLGAAAVALEDCNWKREAEQVADLYRADLKRV